jgi:hypothetical protein
MKPNGAKSHLTPITNFPRSRTSAGSFDRFGFGGSFAFGLAAEAPPATLPADGAAPHATSAATATSNAAIAIESRLIQPLLLRW